MRKFYLFVSLALMASMNVSAFSPENLVSTTAKQGKVETPVKAAMKTVKAEATAGELPKTLDDLVGPYV